MTSSITRSSRSMVKKTSSGVMDHAINKPKSSTNNLSKKKKQIQRSKKDADLENRSHQQQEQQQLEQQQQLHIDKNNTNEITKIDASEHPEYVRLMNQLDQSKNERLKKVENWRNLERQSVHDWFAAQKKQAWDDFYFARKKVRSDLLEQVQLKILKLKQEMTTLNKQTKIQQLEDQQECDYDDWVPPERLNAIGSFVAGASNEEIDRDLTYARQPYNGTPNLVYSDYESRSTTDTAEDADAISPTSRMEANSSFSSSQNTVENDNQHSAFQRHHSATNASNNSNPIYPPFEFEEMSQDERCDWWPYRPTTTA